MSTLLPLPVVFDKNEWFVIIMVIISYSILFFRSKFIPWSIIILLILFSAAIARMADQILAKPMIDYYDIMDSDKYELFGFFTYFLYGPIAYLFVFFYEKFNIQGLSILFYIVGWSLISVIFEWITVWFGVFTFKEWIPLYSFPVYLFVQSLTLLFYLFLKRHKAVAKVK
ncbi:hypothetical protein [Calidifontibacillus erzurumensis]|uniref:Uncharacterized protein n=1 Tax=Calidifontibacillus erzurumensis TaxID=2741433 RepID=A0A8J8KF14_9BACI|nr:hypothetical protein [Calidifontibacillus erzurumensis]NSL52405.1 hypothetical protein [Calidifontibacillus erzurumensis]